MEYSWKHDDEAWAKLVREAARTFYGMALIPTIVALTLFLWLWA
jgi:hypothetical protein